jgi:uncharacterized membrane protein
MHTVKLLAMAIGLIIASVGVFGVAVPSAVLEFGRSLQTPSALYIVAAVRIIFGALLLWVAPESRAPKTLRVLGVLIVIVGVLTPFIGVERSRAMLDWWSTQGPLFTRAWMGVAVVFGLFIVYAVTTPRRSAA